jgi:hypothetical protein
MGGLVEDFVGGVGELGQGVIDTVSDVAESDLGKAALLAGGAYYGAPYLMGEGGAAGIFEGAGGSLFADMSMPSMGQIGSAIQIAGGINSLTGGGITNALGGNKAVSQATNAADPMAQYRQNLAAMYAGALQPGANLDPTQMPGYSQFKSGVLDPSLEAAKRSASKSGMLRSGNEQIALDQIAQQSYSGFMNDYLNRLATGSGVAQSPVAGYNAGTQAQTGIMQGVGGIGTGIASIFGNKPPTTPTSSTNQFEPNINTSGFYDTAPSDINMSGFYRAD